ncbi:GspH/FimT family pseudopilin [Aquipseudomonas guryensis]|jgi:type IV fimbrial biogenesis protein FimT|uniref:GspH/FimT family pseudopilin n=1 Tax=Aquipseudomonas guryensis TaxID=2759165 RepID=UPI002E2B0883|nr:GspH/FimT family pseudopilin [Pseudomonas guryensis]
MSARFALKRSVGFTLVELMIAMAILGILATIALPAFDSFILGSRLRTYSNDFAAAARLARSEALKRNAQVRLCMSADGLSCTTSGSWEQGWIVITSDNVVVHAWPAVNAGYLVSSAATSLTFAANGLGPGMSATVCRATPSVGTQERVVTVSTLGRTSVSTTNTGTCS